MDLTVRAFRTDGLGNPHVALNVAAGGIDIGGDSNGAPATTHTATVADNTSVLVTIQEPGYYSYSMQISNVYMNDHTIDIVMVPVETVTTDPEYLLPTPFFFVFQDPCSFNVDFYSASSFDGETSWYVNNELFSGPNRRSGTLQFCTSGDYQLKVRTTTQEPITCDPLWDRQYATIETGNVVSGIIGNLADYLDDDETVNLTIDEYRPCLTLTVGIDVDPLCDTIDNCCYSRGETVTITPTWTLNRPGADPSLHDISWEVTNPDGTQNSVSPAGLTLADALVDLEAIFDLDMLGAYSVTYTIVDTECGNTFTETIPVETCNFVFIEYDDCNAFNVTNRSSATSFDYVITDIQNQPTGQAGTIAPGETVNLAFTTFGLYYMTVDYSRGGEDFTEIYIIHNYCELERCLSAYITDLLCADTSRCDPCPPDVELNQMVLFYNAYFMKVHTLYGLNNFFTALNNEQLQEITTIDQIMQKLKLFCDRRGCIQDPCAFPAGTATYDWAGQGDNKEQSCNCSPPPSGSYYNTTNPGYCGTCGGKY